MKNSFTSSKSSVLQSEDKYFQTLLRRIYIGFYKEPQSMKMLAIKLKTDRSNICWLCRELRQNNRIAIAKKGLCTITKRIVNYYTTNPKLFPKSNQLKLF